MALTCQTDSRIANATGTWQENCNINVTGYATDAEFIIASYALADSVNPDSDFKLQWRRAAGVFADVAVDTEICWGTATSLVDGNPVANPAGCLATVDDDIENEGDNLAHLDNIANGKYCEIQWALGFGSGVQNSQEYELQLVSVDWANDAVLQTSITTAAGVIGVDAPDNSSPTEVSYTGQLVQAIRLVDATDNQSPTEITVPSLGVVRLIDAADNQSPTEITVPSLRPSKDINAADVSSATEVTVPALNGVRLTDAPDVQASTEITAPSIDGVRLIDASDVSSSTELTGKLDKVAEINAPDISSSTEVTVPSLDGVRLIDAADNSSPTEISSVILKAIRLIDAPNVQSATELTVPTVQKIAGGATKNVNASNVSSSTEITVPTFGKIIDLTKYSPAFA